MPASMQWRDQKDIEPRSFGEDVRIGSGRHAVAGYLAHSQRVGPGIVVLTLALDDDARALVERCRDEGFTALAIRPPLERPGPAVREAVGSLVANWHPRVGILALPGTVAVVAEVDSDESLDAIVACGVAEGELNGYRAPAWGGSIGDEAGFAEALEHLTYHLS